jgi:hypothetical protein
MFVLRQNTPRSIGKRLALTVLWLLPFVCEGQTSTYFDVIKKSIEINQQKINYPPNHQSYEDEIFKYLFSDPVTGNLIYPAANSVEDLGQYLDSFNVASGEIEKMYENILVKSFATRDSISVLNFSLASGSYTAFSYFIDGKIKEDSTAFLVIPGSNPNQSTQIYKNELAGYQRDIAQTVSRFGDTYIYIKPNEDILAFHWNGGKLNSYALHTVLLNKGYSYSAFYFAQLMAFAKELKSRYKKIVILGCSQGGSASLFLSSLVTPDVCVVASGYSILMDQINWMGPDQFIIPGSGRLFTKEFLHNRISAQNTRYLFTYGNGDIAFYKVEAEQGLTANFFSDLNNTTFVSGDFGHTFAQPQTRNFLRQSLFPRFDLSVKSLGTPICMSDSLIVQPHQNAVHHWYRDNQLIATDTRNSLVIDAPGDYSVISYLKDLDFNVPSDTIHVSVAGAPGKPVISSSFGVDTVSICEGDTILLSAEANSADIVWSTGERGPSIEAHAKGEYYARTVNDSGCLSEHSNIITIAILELPKATLEYSIPYICEEGPFSQLKISTSGNYSSYLWNDGQISPSIVVDSEKEVFVQVKDENGCTGLSDSLMVSVNHFSPELQIEGDVVEVLNGSSYQWYFENEPLFGHTRSLQLTNQGTYHVVVRFENSVCEVKSEPVEFHLSDERQIEIMSDQNESLVIERVGINSPLEIQLFNLNGQLIQKWHSYPLSYDQDFVIRTSSLARGIYILRIRSDAGNKTKKIFIQ